MQFLVLTIYGPGPVFNGFFHLQGDFMSKILAFLMRIQPIFAPAGVAGGAAVAALGDIVTGLTLVIASLGSLSDTIRGKRD